MKPKITAYCMDWHINKSDAFKDVLVRPLKDYMNINLIAWDGEKLPAGEEKTLDPLIFCMLPPTLEFAHNTKRSILWLPMWDQAQGYTQEWWNKLPKNIKIVAFSQPIFERATKAGLKTIRLQYFLDPQQIRPTNWENGNVIYYWNRIGLIGPEFLKKLCEATSARKLIFKPTIDPRVDTSNYYNLASHIGKCEVQVVKNTNTKEKHLDTIKEANIVIAPRKTEGIGMEFLESMARGCAVISCDAPTMNEYIKDGVNGIFFEDKKLKIHERLVKKISSKDDYIISDSQVWSKFKYTDYEELGNRAREDSKKGYMIWKKQLAKYAHFIAE